MAREVYVRPGDERYGGQNAKANSYPRDPKLTDEEDEGIRQRLFSDIQRKREDDARWEEAALFAELQEETEQREGSWWREYAKYHRTHEWEAVRIRVLKKAHHVCSVCGGTANTAHHVKYPNGYGPTVQDFIDNEDESLIVAVCNACHARIHGRSITPQSDWRRLPQLEGARTSSHDLCSPSDRTELDSSVGKSERRASHLPKRPKGFVVVVSGRSRSDDGQATRPDEPVHLATVALRATDGTKPIEEYWMHVEQDAWVLCRTLRAPNSSPCDRQWKRVAVASRSDEDIRSAAVYMLYEAWKSEGAATAPELIEAGVCTQNDIRWIFSQAWPSRDSIGQQRPPIAEKKARAAQKRKHR